MKSAIKVAALLAGVAAAGFAGWLAYGAFGTDVDISPAAWDWPKGLSEDEVDRLARGVLAEMTLGEKIAEMSGRGLRRLIVPTLVAGHPKTVYAGGNERLKIPPLSFTDGPRGVVAGRATAFPVTIARAASFDRDLERRVGDAIGQEARAVGANYFGGLCVNLLRHPSWGRAQESYGEDPYLAGEMGLALMRGVQAHNVMACAKHFALNSIENTRYDIDVTLDERTLREVYLPQFRKLVENGVASVMSAYNKVRGVYCGENRELLTDILRRDWGFRGFVSSDWIQGLRDGVSGIHAGMDLEMPSPACYGENVKRYLVEGRVTEDEVDERVLRILRTKLYWVTRRDTRTYDESLIAHPDHTALAREAAEKGMVLLKNDGLLPLRRGEVRKLAVVGLLADRDNMGDHGSSWVRPPYYVTPLAGLRRYLGPDAEVLASDGTDLAAARRLAAEADAVVVVAGFRHEESGEYIDRDGKSPRSEEEMDYAWNRMIGRDRYPLGLRDRDLRLIEAVTAESRRVAVVLVAGSAVTMEEWKDRPAAILMSWFHGLEGGNALARILFGDANPSGKLPVTIPRDLADLGEFDPFAWEVRYGYHHGYTLLDEEGKEAAFPFGFGLSYTSFAVHDLRVLTPESGPDGTLETTVAVTNTGGRAGEEVVQLYVGFEGSAVVRAKKLLRGFEKVALAPGETTTVRFSVPVRELAWYNPAANGWEVESMDYGVLVGPSSRNTDLLRSSFRVRAEDAPRDLSKL